MAADPSKSLRDELSSLKIDRGVKPVQKRGTPRWIWPVASLVLLLGLLMAWRTMVGGATVVEVAFATQSMAGSGVGATSAPANGGVVLQGSGYVVTGNKYISIGVRVQSEKS